MRNKNGKLLLIGRTKGNAPIGSETSVCENCRTNIWFIGLPEKLYQAASFGVFQVIVLCRKCAKALND